MRYIWLGILALLLVVSLDTAYRFLSTPLTASVSVGLRNPVYFSGWTKQVSGIVSLLLGVLWLRLMLAALQTPKKKEKKEVDTSVPFQG